MKAYAVVIPLVASLLVASLLVVSTAFSQEESIPDWIKQSVGWWADGLIPDADFINSIQWLIDAGYINIHDDPQRIVRDGYYSIEQPADWDRQTPRHEETFDSVQDMMVETSTFDNIVPATISVGHSPMLGSNIAEHREVGLDWLVEHLGDAFNHTLAEETVVAGNPGYVDEYTVSIFTLEVQGRSYSFEHEGRVYEIKYENSVESFADHLAEFERLVQTYRLE